jgi:hypothetical protein
VSKPSDLLRSLALRVPHLRRLTAERDALRDQVATLTQVLLERDQAQAPAGPRRDATTPAPLALSREHVRDDARLFANRRDALRCLPREGRVAEVGVAFGDFSELLLEDLSPTTFHAYDLFTWDGSEHIWGRTTGETLRGRTHREYFEERFATAISQGTVEVIQGDSRVTLATAPDAFYDVIYLDADHRYEAVVADVAIATTKLAADGYLVFNDYIIYDHFGGSTFGIVPVVNDLCVNQGWEVAYFALELEMYCDIALRRRHAAPERRPRRQRR